MRTWEYPKVGSHAPHPVTFDSQPGICRTCDHGYQPMGTNADTLDPVHAVAGTCWRCHQPCERSRQDTCDTCKPILAAMMAASRAEQYNRDEEQDERLQATQDIEDALDDTPGHSPTDMSPEAISRRSEAARRHGQAVAYVAAYTGTWGLPLDIRAGKAWGTKHLRLSPAQVDALLKGKERDEQRTAQAAAQADDAVVLWLKAQTASTSTFIQSLRSQVEAGRTLSEKQHAAAERAMAPQGVSAVDGKPNPTQAVTDGWYKVGDDIWKVQKARTGDHLYAKRLDPDTDESEDRWVYTPGGLGIIARSGAVRLTIEEAAAFGHLYGVCCFCGRTLTDETSIAEGIGPVCAARL